MCKYPGYKRFSIHRDVRGNPRLKKPPKSLLDRGELRLYYDGLLRRVGGRIRNRFSQSQQSQQSQRN